MLNIREKTNAAKSLILILSLLLIGAQSAQAADIQWGVNGHPIHNPAYADYEKQFAIMSQNHLTTYRLDIDLAEDSQAQAITKTREFVQLAKKYGITVRPVLEVAFTWGDRTDAHHYPNADEQALYKQGFDRTYNFARLFKDDIQDWELQNEINLLVDKDTGKKISGNGWTAKEFDTPLMKDWSFALKGMSDAILKVNAGFGTNLKIILGTTSTNFGFLDYMESRGVHYDIVGYHYYVKQGESPYKAWSRSTPAFNLFQRLAQFNKPVHFTEVNAAEIYKDSYQNKDNDALTQTGYQSLNDTLGYLSSQKDMNLQEVDIYELLDETAKAPPENRFGLMYDLNTPKSVMAIVRKYSAPTL